MPYDPKQKLRAYLIALGLHPNEAAYFVDLTLCNSTPTKEN